MQLIVRPKPYTDESLESYLLRLSQDNGFECYQVFSGSIKEHLLSTDHDAAGSFPLALDKVNIYHANRSSALRLRALSLIEELTEEVNSRLLQLALMHSSATFGATYKSVHRAGTDIPLCFIRTGEIPCCPACLSESCYARHYWHYLPYSVCHTHRRKLLYHCPYCDIALNYIRSESLIYCTCGYDLRHAVLESATESEIMVSGAVSGDYYDSLNPLLASNNLSMRYGALLWYCTRYISNYNIDLATADLSLAYDYFNNWPQNFHEELQQLTSDKLLRQTKRINHMSLSDVYETTLADCRQLPFRDIEKNFVLDELLKYYIALVRVNPRKRIPNVADLLLSVIDTACLLSTSVKYVFHLLDDGYLPLAIKPARAKSITAFFPIFRLREIIEYRLACKPRHNFSN
ncbi:TniQ family protein [Raoultella ornithinolytica]|uniref:TniQ family protein n=1 Tax=Raoultella ornithinolytica TaxID=54291 RepID=UPI0022A82B84|nr:TniQ family protein [Raoultella ornithinolytica]MCZ0882684.1 TniQ family protein [Raoultella ornithinolytica]MDV0601056.1 TniQ family protein [Raoultella ornithinolytica]MDV1100011.1 TniQ family protein [Raoultella ornithinolytica]HDH7802494.1 TniQ family protein [Raoultella ornithinolytica]HDT6558454.1 TniQ family protein [Raoultella ornithinolytica]